MILITWGLLTLLAFSNAGGDHIKGGGHIKGGDHIKGASQLSVPQALIQQEEVAPAVITKTSVPASVKTAPSEAITKKGAAPFGLKTAHVQHEISGIKTVSASVPAPAPFLAESVKGVKTVSASVPTVGKTSPIPAAAPLQAESVKGLKTVAAATRGKTRFSVSDAQQSNILTQQKLTPAVTKGRNDVLPQAMQGQPILYAEERMSAGLSGIGDARKVVISTPFIRNQELSTDIKLLNRQLMEKQTEEELRRTLEGIVNTDSDFGAITLSEAEINDLSMRVGVNAMGPQARPVIQAPQQIRPDQPQSRPVAVRQRIPASLNPNLIGGGAAMGVFDQRIRYSTTPVITSGMPGSLRRIVPGQTIGGTSAIQGENMQLVLGNTAGRIQPDIQGAEAPKPLISPQAIPKPQTFAPARPKPQAPAPILPQPGLSTDIVELNRQLMQKQSEEEIKRTFEGIVRTDSNLGAITLSEAELADISRRVGVGAPVPAVPAPQQRRPEQLPKPAAPRPQQRRPAPVRQRIPAAPKPQIIGGGAGAVGGFDQRIRYTGTRLTTSGVQGSSRRIIPGQAIGGTSVIQGENMQFVLGNAAGVIQPGSQGAAAPKPRVSPQIIPKPQISAPVLPRPQAPAPILPQPDQGTDIVELNRQLMQKQSEEEIKRTFEGYVRTDSNLGAITLSEAELADISRRVGVGATVPAVPAPQQRRPEQLPKPAAPRPQQRRPAPVIQRIPAAPKPQIIGGGAGAVGGFDQRIRYTGTRLTTSGVQGSSRRIIPGQAIGGTSVIQGENMQFVLGNAAGVIQPGSQGAAAPKPRVSPQIIPKPQISAPVLPRPQAPAPILPQPGQGTDIVELNRQLMQKQSEEEIKRTFEGIVRTDSNLGAITLSEAELADISRRVGVGAPVPAVPAPQQRRPEQLPKPAAPRPQQRRPAPVRQRIPAAPKPQIIGGGAGAVGGFDQRIRYTGTRLTTSGVQGSSRRIIPGQAIRGTSVIQGENMQFVLGNAAGVIQPGSQGAAAPKPRVSPQIIPKPQISAAVLPRPQAPAPILPQPGQGTDIVELNRQLMQKQSEEEIKRTFEGIVRTDSNLGAITLSEAELADISRRVGVGAPVPAVPAPQQRRPEQLPKPAAPRPQQRRPAPVRQRIPAAPKPQIIGGSVGAVGGFDQRIRYTGTRLTTSGVQGSSRRIIPGQAIGGTSVIQGENMQFVLGNAAGVIQPGSQGAAAPKPRVSPQIIPKPQISAPVLPRPQAPAPILPQPGQGTDIVELNRQLMQKQSEEEIKRTFEGIVRTDSTLGAITLSEAELADISRRVGVGAPVPAVPAPQQRRPEQLPKPAAPRPQQRRPAPVRQRIPAAPKPQIIGGGAGAVGGFDQRIRYTGTRLTTSGVQGSSRRIIPGQVIGGTSVIQGENMQFVLGNAAGVIQPESQGAAAPKPRVSPQIIPKPQISAPVLPRPQAPAPILPQPGQGTDIVELNRQLMQKQSEEEIKRTFEGIVRTDSNLGAITLSEAELADISRRVGVGAPVPAVPAPQQRRPEQLPKPAAPRPQQIIPAPVRQRIPAAPIPQIIGGGVGAVGGFGQRIRYTGTQLTTSGVQGSARQIIPGQAIGGTSVIQGEPIQIVGNSAGTVGVSLSVGQRAAAALPRVSPQALPKPQVSSLALSEPLITSPILSAPGLSADIIELNRQLMQKQSEEELRQALSGVLKADADFNKVSLSADELNAISRDLSGRVSASLSPASVIPVPYADGIVESQRSSSGSSRDAQFQRFGGAMRGSILTGARTSNAQSAINAASKMQVMSQVQQKVGQESIESPLGLQQNIEPSLTVAQVEEPVVQSKLTQTIKAFNAPISQTVQNILDTSDSRQLQLRVDDVIEQSQLPKPAVVEQMQLKRNIDLPSRKSKMALDNLSQKYLQEKLPVEIPNYVPLPSFMSPFNYRVPHLRSPIVQQQERLDQILV